MRRLGLSVRKAAALALLAAALLAGYASRGLAQSLKIDVQSCDRLAANPRDPQRIAGVDGVEYHKIDYTLAIPACEAAVAAFPLEQRFQGMLAALYYSKANYEAALPLSRTAASGGNVLAMDILGSLHLFGLVPGADPKEAKLWLEKASAAGFSEADYGLGHMNEFGVGVAKNVVLARSLYRRAAETGLAQAYKALGDSLAAETGNPNGPAEAADAYRRGADLGGAAAMQALGDLHFNGKGVPQSETEAARFFLQAAEAGDSKGMSDIGYMYLKGRGVRKDEGLAFTWYKKSADAGNTAGMVNLAWAYYNAWGTKEDKSAAYFWHYKAAELNDGGGFYGAAYMQNEGSGTPQDLKAAANNMLRALALGDTSARSDLANRYADWNKQFRELMQKQLAAEGFFKGRQTGTFDDATLTAVDAYILSKQKK